MMKAPLAKSSNVRQLAAPSIPPAYLTMAQAQIQAMGKTQPPTDPATLKATNAPGQ